MRGDRRCDAAVGCRGEHERAALPLLLAQEGQHLGVVGQQCGVELGPAGDLFLEVGAAAQQPPRQHEDQRGIASQQAQQRLDERVGSDQRAVQVDAKHGGACGRRGSCVRGAAHVVSGVGAAHVAIGRDGARSASG